MSSISSQPRNRNIRPLARRVISAGVLLGLVACAGPGSQVGSTSTEAQLAAGWQEHSRPLINFGAARQPGTTAWLVPTNLPRGTYRVINREGDGARLIEGYRIEFDGSPAKEVRLLLPFTYGNVEALDEKYVNLGSARAAP